MTAPILYIEDEEDYQILVKRILSRAGLEVVIAETGAEGMKALEQSSVRASCFSISICRIRMDTRSAVNCARILRGPISQF